MFSNVFDPRWTLNRSGMRDSQFSRGDFSLVHWFWFKFASKPLRSMSQLSKMVWHLHIGAKMTPQLTKMWGVAFLVKILPNLQGAFWGTYGPFLVQPKVLMDAPLIVFHIFEVKFNFWEPHFPDTKFYPIISSGVIWFGLCSHSNLCRWTLLSFLKHSF